MAAKESYKEKQEAELEVLRSIFNQDDVIDLRPSQENERWFPLDLKIKLEPQRGSAMNETFCHCFLRIKAPKNYPKVTPKLSIEDSKGLSNADITQLQTQLNKEAYGLKGEVCIFELCQLVQGFLHERNKPPKGSFFDEMMAQKLKKDEEEKKSQAEKEQKWNQQYADEVTKRKELLKKEQRTRRSTLNDSPMRNLSSESTSECNIFEVCEEHKRTETLLLPLEGKKILLGACLGHSIKGCINYSGIDYGTGKLYYITEWTVRNSLLEARNLEISTFIENVERKVQMLMKLKHTNIVNYEGVVCNKKKDFVQIFLLQEFILGISICSMSESCFNWNTESVSSMTKGILEGLIFLHNNGVSHDNLTDSAIFLDSSGVIKLSDYSIIPYIQEVINGIPFSFDLPSLGALIESLLPTPHALEMRNFINDCKSERTLSASSLLEHPFLYNIPIAAEHQAQTETKIVSNHPPPVTQTTTITPTTAVISTHSRLKSEFEIIKEIGQGAYGKVLKVRNNLDNRFYAIKKIPLSGLNKQLYRKVRREVELLSRLNHENVVRYYSSWTEQEIATIEEEDSDDEDEDSDSTTGKHKNSLFKAPSRREKDEEVFDVGWNYLSDSSSDSDEYDDDIEFVDSQGRVAKYDDDESGSDAGTNGHKAAAKRKEVLYIQMEFCEKLTLRSAIDNGLLGDKGRIWKLFREIVEGLTHLHQQGMIHRDLKCDNIFLDSKDHVKIGDFGLATTNILALQNQNAEATQALHLSKISFGDSQTGLVGTALYCAPEITQAASKSIYNQKVDLYSLGIIFFEMCNAKFNTGMERNQVLQDLRRPEIVFPKPMMNDEFKRERQVISWLLDHNPHNRPTSEELLQSDLMPPAKVEASEIQEMFRHVLANPQSRNYKNLINRIMQQENDDIVNSAYHTNMYFISAVFENVKIIIEQIFRRHGALDVSTPLLTPYHKSDSDSLVRLMTHSGSIVTLPMDLRQTFLRMIAQNVQIQWLRRYAIGRTYRERKAHNQHPKQTYECVFDIVSPIRGHSMLVDAELLAIVQEIISNFEILKQRNISIKINHTSLLRAIFLYYSVPAAVYKSILALIKDYFDNAKISKKQLISSVTSLLPARAPSKINDLIEALLITDLPISNLSSTNLRVIIEGRGDAKTLAKGALRELETVITLSQAMGVTIPITICVNLTMGFDCSRGSILWNLCGETKPGKSTLLAYGGRFDYQLEDYQKTCHKLRELYCAGFTIAMDKLITCLNLCNEYHSVVDLVVFITGTRPPVKDICQIMNSLWTANIKCCFIESLDDDDIARNLGANHIFILGEDGCIRIKSWQSDRYQERSVSRGEAIEYLKKNLSVDFYVGAQMEPNNLVRNNSISSINETSATILPSYEIDFITIEKLNASKRKRLENQIEQKFEKVLHKFSRKENFIIFAIELDAKQIRALLSCIDPNSKDQSQTEFDAIMKGFPKNKQDHLQEVYDEITDRLNNNKSSIIVGIFGIPDSYYRLIL